MVFPATPLGVTCELQLAGTWTDITGYCLQEGTPLTAYQIGRGRGNETTAASPSQLTVKLNNTDGRFSPRNPTGAYYPNLTRNTPVRVSVPDTGVYLRFADDATSACTTPDSASLQITGSIDIRIDLALDNWAPAVLCSKFGASGSAWALSLNADGSVTLTWNNGSVNKQVSTAGLAVLPLGRSMLRATLNTATGQVQFFTAAAMAGTQTLLATVNGSATSVAAAAGQAVSVGDSASYDALFGTKGCQGKVYEFQLLSGIGGTLVADPVFTSATAGAATLTDAQGNVWTPNGSAAFSKRAYRFHGECSSLPQNWDVTGHDVTAPVTAGGVLRRLQQASAPLKSVMRRGVPAWPSVKSSAMTSLSALPSTIAYWPAEDSAGATQIASGLAQNTDGIVPPAMTVAGTAAFQGAIGSPAADGTFACSAALAQVQSSIWTGRVPPYSANGSATSVMFLLTIPSGGYAGSPFIAQFTWAGGQAWISYTTASGGTLRTGPFAAATGVNGGAFLVQLVNVGTGSPAAQLNILPLGRGQAVASSISVAGTTGQLESVVINPFAAALGATEVGQIWVQAAFSSAGSQQALPGLTDPKIANLLNAYQGEAAGTRFARLCTENSFAPRVYGYPAVTQPMGAQAVDTLANLLQSIEDADRGQIFEPRQALGLGYRTYASLTSQPAAFTLDFNSSADEISPPLTPVDDDQLIRNDVTVTRSGGSAYEAQVTSGPLSVNAPPAGAGAYPSALTGFFAYDSQAAQIASWMAWAGTADRERFPQVTIDLASSDVTMQTLLPAMRDADIGSFLALVNPPGAWLPPDQVSLLYWGITESLGDFAWAMTLNCVPEYPYEVGASGGATARWSFAVSGTPADGTFFSVTTAQSASIAMGDTLTDTKNPGVIFTVTKISAPFGGFVAVNVFPTAAVIMSSPDTVTQAAASARADTAGSQLHSSATSGATSLSVDITAGNLWTTSGFPFDIQCAGERMTVTNITGGSSPQTFTVTRSVNGVVKAQAAGAAIRLWATPVPALAGAA